MENSMCASQNQNFVLWSIKAVTSHSTTLFINTQIDVIPSKIFSKCTTFFIKKNPLTKRRVLYDSLTNTSFWLKFLILWTR